MKRCLKVSKGHAFSESWGSKKHLGRFCLSDVLIRGMALRTHNMPSGRLKNDFDEVDEANFKGVEWP
jgi:hypothetical protein